MQKVLVRGADGIAVPLVFVFQKGATVYVCAESRYKDAVRGDGDYLVGFPAETVEGLDRASKQ